MIILFLLLLQTPEAITLHLQDGKVHTIKGVLYPGTSRDHVRYRFKVGQGERIHLKLNSSKVSHRGSDSVGAVFFIVDSNGSTPPDLGDYEWGGPVEWGGVLDGGDYTLEVVIEDSPDAPDHKALRKRRTVIRYTLRACLSPPSVEDWLDQ